MMKAMCMLGMLFGILAVFVFAFDLALGFPFQRASVTLDIGFVVAGLVLVYMSWSAKREVS